MTAASLGTPAVISTSGNHGKPRPSKMKSVWASGGERSLSQPPSDLQSLQPVDDLRRRPWSCQAAHGCGHRLAAVRIGEQVAQQLGQLCSRDSALIEHEGRADFGKVGGVLALVVVCGCRQGNQNRGPAGNGQLGQG